MTLGSRNPPTIYIVEVQRPDVTIVLTIFAVAVGATILLIGLLLMIGPESVWSKFGPADLGPMAFETLERRLTPNDALACPAQMCGARSDLVPPLFGVSAEELRAAMARVIASEPRVVLVDSNDTELTDRYVQRSAVFKFPDTIVVRYVEEPGGRGTLAMYSRSQLGRSDLGVNKARLERWLVKLKLRAPVAQ